MNFQSFHQILAFQLVPTNNQDSMTSTGTSNAFDIKICSKIQQQSTKMETFHQLSNELENFHWNKNPSNKE